MKRTFLLWGLIAVILIAGIIMILFSKYEVIMAERERAQGLPVRGDMPEGPILPEPAKVKRIVDFPEIPEMPKGALLQSNEAFKFELPEVPARIDVESLDVPTHIDIESLKAPTDIPRPIEPAERPIVVDPPHVQETPFID